MHASETTAQQGECGHWCPNIPSHLRQNRAHVQVRACRVVACIKHGLNVQRFVEVPQRSVQAAAAAVSTSTSVSSAHQQRSIEAAYNLYTQPKLLNVRARSFARCSLLRNKPLAAVNTSAFFSIVNASFEFSVWPLQHEAVRSSHEAEPPSCTFAQRRHCNAVVLYS